MLTRGSTYNAFMLGQIIAKQLEEEGLGEMMLFPFLKEGRVPLESNPEVEKIFHDGLKHIYDWSIVEEHQRFSIIFLRDLRGQLTILPNKVRDQTIDNINHGLSKSHNLISPEDFPEFTSIDHAEEYKEGYLTTLDKYLNDYTGKFFSYNQMNWDAKPQKREDVLRQEYGTVFQDEEGKSISRDEAEKIKRENSPNIDPGTYPIDKTRPEQKPQRGLLERLFRK